MNNIIKVLITTAICLCASAFGDPFINNLSTQYKESAPFKAPSQRQIEKESVSTIQSSLPWQGGGDLKHWEWWMKIIKTEERGVFGYHAAKQQYRIFQDIIKMVFIEVLEIEVKNDFHFFRVPLAPELQELNSAETFVWNNPQINDAYSPVRDQILSMNYTLLGNYNDGSQCTVCYFSKNQSWFNIYYTDKLKFLFNELGMPTKEIDSLLATGNSFINSQTGVIYQFTDLSHQSPNFHNAYELVDLMAYSAKAAGPVDPYVNAALSDIFLGNKPKKFDSHSGQIRLIMNTAVTLNPNSPISIRRFDLLDPAVVNNYEKNLREKIRNLPRISAKVENYKQKLKAYWYEQ